MKRTLAFVLIAVLSRVAGAAPVGASLAVEPAAVLELLPLAGEALQIMARASAREAAHTAQLQAKGVAEEPPDAGNRYVLDAPGLEGFAFDDGGELYIDRRFVTDEEMKTVHAVERWIRKWFPQKTAHRKSPQDPKDVQHPEVPRFRGFSDSRYQMHDALIVRYVKAFNADKSGWCGGTAEQAARIPDLTPALVKAHMIEESGGRGARSVAAWKTDPLQVNVPGDWGAEKTLVGLSKPSRRNEGSADGNVRAAIMYLARKGFSASARPASERKKGSFAGWRRALQRYNGRRDRTDSDRYYSDEYADKIIRRASQPDLFVPVEIRLKESASR